MEKHDLLILGGAAVGTAAAVYGVRAKIDLKVIAKDLGGEVANSGEIENWPGINHTTGIELSENFNKQLEYNHVPIDRGVIVTSVTKEGAEFLIKGTKDGADISYQAKAVIIGTGAHPRHMNIPGEKEYYQKGVSYCTTCDGPLFKNKNVVTIGGGNSALESAIMMSGIASKVTIVNLNPEFRGEKVYVEKLNNTANVQIIYEAKTTKILGNTLVTGLEYEDKNGQKQILDGINGIFAHIGIVPNADFIDIVEKDAVGQIKTDKLGRTSVPGIWAAGDVTDIPFNQISVAAGQGVTALLDAQNYLNQL